MGRRPPATYLWPGLPQLWQRGSWAALFVAIAAGMLLNAVILGTLVWVELFTPATRTIGVAAVAALWLGAALYSRFWDHAGWPPAPDPARDAYPAALDDYLKGNWFEAEQALDKILRRNPRDIEARLLRTSVLRHTGRRDEAAAELDALERLEDSHKWSLEIDSERRRLEAGPVGVPASAGKEEDNQPKGTAAA